MGSILLKLVSVETVIEFLIALLASRVKNPGSPEAIRLRSIVFRLNKATGDFLTLVP